MSQDDVIPALLGGAPVRNDRPFPAWPVFDESEERALLRVLRSGKWGRTEGPETDRFERRFADFVGAKHAITVVNGTVSLRIALLAAGIGAGDEVIVPPYTFIATATAVIEANATPVFVDIELETANLDPRQIEAAITPRTRAIIPVHLGGMPCDMDAINAIAHKHRLTVIEDAAHAHGSAYKSRPVGALGDMGSFSFQSSKNLNVGEGGIIVTNDDALAATCRSIHNCGRRAGGAWYEHEMMGSNYRFNEFGSAVLNCQLDRLDEQTNRRDANGRYLDAELSKIPGIFPQRRGPEATRNAQHLYCFRFDEGMFGFPRQRFVDAVTAEGVPVFAGYVLPLYRQPMFIHQRFGPYTAAGAGGAPRPDYGALHLPNVERLCGREGAWMTQNMLLGTREDMQDIVRAFEKVYAARERLAASAPCAPADETIAPVRPAALGASR
jgi:dTDP-4-amino-4,6-dideoxygalactose transaminase